MNYHKNFIASIDSFVKNRRMNKRNKRISSYQFFLRSLWWNLTNFFGRCSVIFLVLVLTFSSIFAEWMDNYQNALDLANKENKKILIDFTGSDWCQWCMKLKEDTFDQNQFKDYANKNLILVEVDFPQSKILSPEIKKQNNDLQNKYKVEGFPTIILIDGQEHIIKQESGYIANGPKGMIEWIENNQTNQPTQHSVKN